VSLINAPAVRPGELYRFTNPTPTHRFIGILDEKRIPKGIIIYATNMTPSANKVSFVWMRCRSVGQE
jgi:hypothetical protein